MKSFAILPKRLNSLAMSYQLVNTPQNFGQGVPTFAKHVPELSGDYQAHTKHCQITVMWQSLGPDCQAGGSIARLVVQLSGW